MATEGVRSPTSEPAEAASGGRARACTLGRNEVMEHGECRVLEQARSTQRRSRVLLMTSRNW